MESYQPIHDNVQQQSKIKKWQSKSTRPNRSCTCQSDAAENMSDLLMLDGNNPPRNKHTLMSAKDECHQAYSSLSLLQSQLAPGAACNAI